MKIIKTILLFIFISQCAFAQTRSSWLDLKDVPLIDVRGGGLFAKGDGVADDTNAIKKALASGSILLPRGSYRITSSINIPSDRTIVGLDAKLIMEGGCTIGTSIPDQQTGLAAVALSGPHAIGTTTINYTGGPAVENAYYFLRETTVPAPYGTFDNWLVTATTEERFWTGEIIQANAVTASTISTDKPLPYTYNTGDSTTPALSVWQHSKNIGITGVTFVATGTSASTQDFVLSLSNARNVVVKDCRFELNGLARGIYLNTCIDFEIVNNNFNSPQDMPIFSVGFSANGVIQGNTIRNLTSADGGIFLGMGSNNIVVNANTISGSDVITDSLIYGIVFHAGVSRCRATSNTISGINVGIGILFNAHDNTIADNVISDCRQWGIFVNGICRATTITCNNIIRCANDNATAQSAIAAAVTFNGSISTHATGNTISLSSRGFYLNNAAKALIEGNFTRETAYGAELNGSVLCRLIGNQFIDCTANTPVAILGETSYCDLNGNYIENSNAISFGSIYDGGTGYCNTIHNNIASGSDYLFFTVNTATGTWQAVSLFRNQAPVNGAMINRNLLTSAAEIATFTPAAIDIPTGFTIYPVAADGSAQSYESYRKTASGTEWIRRVASETSITIP